MVTVYGMNDKLGNVSFYDSKGADGYNFNKPYSEQTAREIDEEARKIIASAYERTRALLSDKQDKLEILAQELLVKEVLFQSDLERLIGPRPFEQLTTYQEFTRNEDKKAADLEKANKEAEEALPAS
jgi:AFG3 family protein